MDPRLEIIDERLKNIKKIIAVSGGKGGIGKSLSASLLALALKKSGYSVGLFDLDFTSPSAHIILGAEGGYPKESKGIVPPEFSGIKFMSVVYYTHSAPLPIRGGDISNVLIELLTIVRWGKLDFLIIDMPPGISDVTLDVVRLVKKVRFIIITTQSKLVLETVKKMITVLKNINIPIIGAIENMRTTESEGVKNEIKKYNLNILAKIDFDRNIERCLGNAVKLSSTNFTKKMMRIVKEIL